MFIAFTMVLTFDKLYNMNIKVFMYNVLERLLLTFSTIYGVARGNITYKNLENN